MSLVDDLTIEQTGDTVVAHIGAADVPHTLMQEVVETCVSKMRYDGARYFVIDLQNAEFLASACLGVLVELLQELEHARGRVALAGCNDTVAFLFKVTKLDNVFRLAEDVEEAIESF